MSLKWERSRKWMLPQGSRGSKPVGCPVPPGQAGPLLGAPMPHGPSTSPQSDACRALVRAAAELTLPPRLPLQSNGVRGREGRAGGVRVMRSGQCCPPLRMEADWGAGTSVSEPQAGGWAAGVGGAGVRRHRLANLGASGVDGAPSSPQGAGWLQGGPAHSSGPCRSSSDRLDPLQPRPAPHTPVQPVLSPCPDGEVASSLPGRTQRLSDRR